MQASAACRCPARLAGPQREGRVSYAARRPQRRCGQRRLQRRVAVLAAGGGGGSKPVAGAEQRIVEYKVCSSRRLPGSASASTELFQDAGGNWIACGPCHSQLQPSVPLSQPPPRPRPFAAQDSLTDIAFIGLCRIAYGNIAGWQSSRSWTDGHDTFKGMVEVSRALMRGRTAAQQRDAVIAGFPEVPPWFRK